MLQELEIFTILVPSCLSGKKKNATKAPGHKGKP